MKSAESIAILYKVFSEFEGKINAKEAASDTVSFIICELLEENLPVTPELIEQRLSREALDYQSMAEANKKKSIA